MINTIKITSTMKEHNDISNLYIINSNITKITNNIKEHNNKHHKNN